MNISNLKLKIINRFNRKKNRAKLNADIDKNSNEFIETFFILIEQIKKNNGSNVEIINQINKMKEELKGLDEELEIIPFLEDLSSFIRKLFLNLNYEPYILELATLDYLKDEIIYLCEQYEYI